jgi:phage protein D
VTVPFNPHAVVEIGGRRYDSWRDARMFESVDVELATNEPSEAEVRVFDPDPEYAFINSITQGDGVAEAAVKIWLGYGETENLGRPLFEGVLARVERDQGTTICRAYDNGFKMRKLQKTENHNKTTFLKLIEKLARRNGLGFEGPDAPPSLETHPIKQEARTDWAMALQCADEAGLVLHVRGNTLYAKGPAKTAAEALLTLHFRKDFQLLDDFRLNFKVPENVEGRPAKVQVHARGRGGRRLKGQSQVHARGHERVEIKNDLHRRSGKAAAARAAARKELQREHAFTGEVAVLPSFQVPRVDVRATVALAGLPKLFNGKYLADRVAHRFAPGELTMQLTVYRDIKN